MARQAAIPDDVVETLGGHSTRVGAVQDMMAGLVAHVRAGRIAAGSRVLFVHTGGLPAIFAYADRLDSCLSEAPWASAG